jgi:hypothetical protein
MGLMGYFFSAARISGTAQLNRDTSVMMMKALLTHEFSLFSIPLPPLWFLVEKLIRKFYPEMSAISL